MKRSLKFGTATAAVLAVLGAGAGLAGCQDNRPVEAVYGPPSMLGLSSSEGSSDTEEPIEDVYGPPVETDSHVVVDSQGISENAVEAVYGPPPDWEGPIGMSVQE